MIVQRFRREFTPTADIEEYRHLADTLRSEVQRVNSIITQFLEFARPPRAVRVREDLRSVVAHALDVVRSEAAERGVTIAHTAPDTPLAVEVDRHRMTQALLNIIRNAFEAMEGGGTLTVAVSAPARIDIGDTGAGIPPEARARIFNLYYTTKASGTGLGLSIVHQIVSEHDGTIAAESAAGDGTGARFVITLPPAHETAP
jgi:two-component system sensor histidine kinase HydH